jgi:hypothetical protein
MQHPLLLRDTFLVYGLEEQRHELFAEFVFFRPAAQGFA